MLVVAVTSDEGGDFAHGGVVDGVIIQQDELSILPHHNIFMMQVAMRELCTVQGTAHLVEVLRKFLEYI